MRPLPYFYLSFREAFLGVMSISCLFLLQPQKCVSKYVWMTDAYSLLALICATLGETYSPAELNHKRLFEKELCQTCQSMSYVCFNPAIN